ncbi:MAG: carbohydrate ABC transporter permease [Gaiellaceae bacterium]
MRLRPSSARRRGGEPTGGTASRVVRGGRRWDLVRFTFIGLYFLFLLLPMYWALITAFKPQEDILAQPPVWFPSDPTFSYFGSALNRLNGLTGIKNSLIVAFATTFLAVVIGAAAAYSMARFRTGGKHLAFWFLSQRLLPPVAVVLPIFLLYSRYSEEWLRLRLYDTRIGLVLLYTVFSLPWTVWMMYSYFRQMPPELEHAALVDGCSRWQALWKIAIPLAAPGVVSAAAFAFIFSWTEFLFAFLLTGTNATTLPVLLAGYVGVFQGNLWGETAAMTLISLIPAVLLGIFLQRHLVRGLTVGAVQG